MNTAAQQPLLEAHRSLSEAFRLLDGAIGLLPNFQHSAALDVRNDVAHAMKQTRALALFAGIAPGDLEP